MTSHAFTPAVAAALARHAETAGDDLLSLLRRRRSVRRLRGGSVPNGAIDRILEAVRLTPSAGNRPPWHVLLIHDDQATFWHVVEEAFRDRLAGDRLERYLDRLAGFRGGVATALVYEDVSVAPRLQELWNIPAEQAQAFAEQGVGMVQLALWLAITREGLVTSLQHWEWLAEGTIARFLGVPADRFRLKAVLPIGFADEEPRPIEPVPLDQLVSFGRFGRGGQSDGSG